MTALELCDLIVNCNALKEAYEARALTLLERGHVGRARVLLARAVHWNGTAFLAWCRLGRTDLLPLRDMAAYARAQLGFPINDVFPARALPTIRPKPARPRFGKVVSAVTVELPEPDLTPASVPPTAPWSRPIPQRLVSNE